MDLTEIIKQYKPNVKDNTIKQYVIQLNRLKKIIEKDNFDFLKNFDSVEKILSDKHYTTVRNFYNSIIVYLQAVNENDEIIKKYVKARDDLNEQYQNSQTETISEKQKKNFPTMDEFNKMLDTMTKQIRSQKIKTKGDLTGKEKELLMMYTIFNMLRYIPTRNDIAGMVLTTPNNYPKMDKEKNYLVVGRSQMYLILNDYKTNKTYGKDKKIDVTPQTLVRTLRSYIRATGKKTGDVLFTTSTGNPISRNVLSQMLMKTSKKYMDKSVSTTIIRKMVVSHELGDFKKTQTDLADKMQHSVATQNHIYIKEQ
jgi:RNase adaptor protein for sRNA GlmZ degradation